MIQRTILFLIIIFFNACSSKNIQEPFYSKQEQLSLAIQSLSSKIDKEESQLLAYEAIQYSKILAKKYDITLSPWFHNFLIHMKVKEEGFCYDFTEDLIIKLKKLNLKTIWVHWADHKRTQYWEHNSIVVTSKNQAFEEGLVLDAWRNKGELFFKLLKEDSKYQWKEHLGKSKYFGSIQ